MKPTISTQAIPFPPLPRQKKNNTKSSNGPDLANEAFSSNSSLI